MLRGGAFYIRAKVLDAEKLRMQKARRRQLFQSPPSSFMSLGFRALGLESPYLEFPYLELLSAGHPGGALRLVRFNSLEILQGQTDIVPGPP